jgi:carbon-monoxide dehydrogenase iron sulfur subunit
MARVLAIMAENCTGCRMCELACSSFKEGEFIPERSRIRVVDNRLEGWSRPAVCMQCEEPMCVAVCSTQAISRTRTAQGDPVVEVDTEKCVGCQSCLVACPFGSIGFSPKVKAIKCDLCGGSPKCVQFCFYDCLHFAELSEREAADRAKKVKALTAKACREIGKDEVRRRRAAFSLEASKVTPHVPPKEERESIELDFDRLLRRNTE